MIWRLFFEEVEEKCKALPKFSIMLSEFYPFSIQVQQLLQNRWVENDTRRFVSLLSSMKYYTLSHWENGHDVSERSQG